MAAYSMKTMIGVKMSNNVSFEAKEVGANHDEVAEIPPSQFRESISDNCVDIIDDEGESRQNAVTFLESAEFDEDDDEEYCTMKCGIRPRMLKYCCVASAIGGSVYGWDLGAHFTNEFNYYFGFECPLTESDCDVKFNEEQVEKFNDFMLIVVCVGEVVGAAVIAPIVFDKYGRKAAMLTAIVSYLFGIIVQAFSVHIAVTYAFMFISYLGLGALNMSCPLYLAEMAPIHRRGQLTSLWYLGATLGLIAVSMWNLVVQEVQNDNYHGWRVTYVGDFVLAIAFIIVLRIIPESHYFLLMQNRKDDARNVLKQIRHKNNDGGIEWELKEIEKEINLMKEEKKYNCMNLRLLYGIFAQLMLEFTGFRCITAYAYYVVAQVYGHHLADVGTIFIYVFNFIASIFAFYLIERIGRPMMMFSGGFVISVVLGMTMLAANVIGVTGYPSPADAGFFLLLYVLFEMGFSFSWGTVSWIYCAEIFDIGTRAISYGICTATQSIAAAIIEAFFINYDEFSPRPFEFYTFIGFSLSAMFFAYYLVPETANKTSAEIREEFKQHRPKLVRLNWGPN